MKVCAGHLVVAYKSQYISQLFTISDFHIKNDIAYLNNMYKSFLPGSLILSESPVKLHLSLCVLQSARNSPYFSVQSSRCYLMISTKQCSVMFQLNTGKSLKQLNVSTKQNDPLLTGK